MASFSRRLLKGRAAVLAIITSNGCGAAPAPKAPADAAPSLPAPVEAGGGRSSLVPPLPLWNVPVLASPLVLAAPPFRSLGHAGGKYLMATWVSDRTVYAAKTPVPAAFVACAEHREGIVTAPGDLVTCLRKLPASSPDSPAWQYGVFRRGGTSWLRLGTLPDCEQCHSTAARDHLFGIP